MVIINHEYSSHWFKKNVLGVFSLTAPIFRAEFIPKKVVLPSHRFKSRPKQSLCPDLAFCDSAVNQTVLGIQRFGGTDFLDESTRVVIYKYV